MASKALASHLSSSPHFPAAARRAALPSSLRLAPLSNRRRCGALSTGGHGRAGTARVSASAATATEKPSAAPEIVLQPIKDISGTVKLPGSKSLSNRILLLAALAEGTTTLDNLLYSDDVRYMLAALRTLGLAVEDDSTTKRAVVVGSGGQFPSGTGSKEEIQLFLGNAGTAMRPLTAAVTAAGGNASYVLDGVPRMRERPIGDLVSGLKQLGADVDCFLGTNCPPVRVNGSGGLPGGKVSQRVSMSDFSMLDCPCAKLRSLLLFGLYVQALVRDPMLPQAGLPWYLCRYSGFFHDAATQESALQQGFRWSVNIG